MKIDDIDEFFRNLEAYVAARKACDFDIANIINGRLRAFLERDILAAKDENPNDNPYKQGEFMVTGGDLSEALPKIVDGLAGRLKKDMERTKQFARDIKQHWQEVRGTTAGDKLPMINYIRDAAVKYGLDDIGIVKTRHVVEHLGCYNGATNEINPDDGEGWKDRLGEDNPEE